MSEPRPPLADLTGATLDDAALDALFADLAAFAEIDQVLIKDAATANAGTAIALDDARKALAAGARGVQIRYRWQGRWWFDTLLRTPTGTRIIRMPVPDPP